MTGTFKKDTPFEDRRELYERISKKYPERVPIVVETNSTGTAANKLTLNKQKFLVPESTTMGSFLHELRQHTNVGPEEAVFLFCGENSALVPTSSTLDQVYNQYKSTDGFLYISIAKENTFGDMVEEQIENVLNSASAMYQNLGLHILF